MEELVEILNGLIEKYQIEEQDVAMLQEALSQLETGMEEEFTYETEEK